MTHQPPRHNEAAFESVIEAHFLDHDYTRLSDGYDRGRALFPDAVISFIRETQPKEWAKLEALHGAHTAARVLDDVCTWLDTYGALHTLRHGFKCYGRTLRIAFFKAAHELNAELAARYAANQWSWGGWCASNRPRAASTGAALTRWAYQCQIGQPGFRALAAGAYALPATLAQRSEAIGTHDPPKSPFARPSIGFVCYKSSMDLASN